MGDIRSITNDLLSEVIADALRRHVGPGRTYTYDQAALAVGVERRTMQSWVLGETPPQSHKLVRIFRWLGPDVANDVLGLAGLMTLPVQQPDGDEFALNEDMAALLFKLAWALKDDGRIDHQELAEIIPVARIAHARVGAWLAEHDPKIRPLKAG